MTLTALDIQTCTDEMASLINNTKAVFTKARVVVSLGTPRADGYHEKMSKVNANIRHLFRDNHNVKLCYHDNLQRNGRIKSELFRNDGYHLNQYGTSVLAANIRYSVDFVYSRRAGQTKGDQTRNHTGRESGYNSKAINQGPNSRDPQNRQSTTFMPRRNYGNQEGKYKSEKYEDRHRRGSGDITATSGWYYYPSDKHQNPISRHTTP